MKKLLLFKMIFFLATLAQAQKIKEVKIGEQIWMSENLNVDKFRNGDPIPQAKTAEEWKKSGEEGKPAWCYYDHNPKNGKKYGKLYNWFAVNDPRGIAPEGWHVASSKEFESLCLNLGVNIKIETDTTQLELIKKLKSSNWGGKNENNQFSRFNLLPSSFRNNQGTFGNENNCNILFKDGIEFSISGSGQIYYNDDESFTAGDGLSVRCVKD
jgi:uncharacterized protein (TIGR02145 family)